MFIVVEIGVNWDGDFVLVREMMEKAKEFGCDAVKFQSFNEEQVKEHPEFVRLMKSSISKNNVNTPLLFDIVTIIIKPHLVKSSQYHSIAVSRP